MSNRAIFLDRDGTVARDVRYCRRPEDFELLPNAAAAIRLFNEAGLKVIVITNQSGIARGFFTEETLGKIHEKMKSQLAREGARVDAIYYCPHHPEDGCDCRKPKPRLVRQAAKDFALDLEHSFVIGDMQMDIDLGKAIGSKTILVNTSSVPWEEWDRRPDAVASDVWEAAQIIVRWDSLRSGSTGNKRNSSSRKGCAK